MYLWYVLPIERSLVFLFFLANGLLQVAWQGQAALPSAFILNHRSVEPTRSDLIAPAHLMTSEYGQTLLDLTLLSGLSF